MRLQEKFLQAAAAAEIRSSTIRQRKIKKQQTKAIDKIKIYLTIINYNLLLAVTFGTLCLLEKK